MTARVRFVTYVVVFLSALTLFAAGFVLVMCAPAFDNFALFAGLLLMCTWPLAYAAWWPMTAAKGA